MSVPSAERYQRVAELHAANLDRGFLATLGVEFLALMYWAIDADKASVLLTEERDGKVVGFIAGGRGMGSIYRRMLGRPLRLARALLPSLVRPKRLVRILEILRYSAGGKRQARNWPEAELLSLAVDKSARGAGVAERLYRKLERHFGRQGVPNFRIIVGETLTPAHRFYVRMGATPLDTIEVHAGETSRLYVHDLLPDGDSRGPISTTQE